MSPPREVVLNQGDVLRIVQALKVVVRVVDTQENARKASIVGMQNLFDKLLY